MNSSVSEIYAVYQFSLPKATLVSLSKSSFKELNKSRAAGNYGDVRTALIPFLQINQPQSHYIYTA